jgi:DNA-binding LacI/PurR family transcriptional regulator
MSLLRLFLEQRGIQIPAERIIHKGPDFRDRLRDLLTGPNPPTALFCWHDRLAYRVLEICEEFGVSVPEKLSIIGYDGLRWPAATPHTATSILVDLGQLTSSAVAILDRYVCGFTGPLIEDVLPVSFLPGTTLGPAKKH